MISKRYPATSFFKTFSITPYRKFRLKDKIRFLKVNCVNLMIISNPSFPGMINAPNNEIWILDTFHILITTHFGSLYNK